MNLFKNYLDQLKKGLDQMDISILEEIAHILFEALIKERLVFVIGNGGSASTASHLACDLGKNTILDLKGEEKRFRVICPSDNVAMSTAYANDIGYDAIFEQPLKNFLQKKDILIAISASGNSLNVLNAVKYAKKKGAITIGFVGFSGGKLRQLCDYVMHFPENHYGRSEDAHLILSHMLREALLELKISKTEN